jgi:benzil reductase ((S)-benzoin forming)
MEPDVVIILSSGVIPYWENTLNDISYKLSTYEHFDNFGTLGGKDRASAGAIIAKKFPLAKIIVTSSRSIDGAPSHAEVMRNELIVLGVNAGRITLEEISTNLTSQLSESIKISIKNKWLNLLFVTSEFHVARTQLMVDMTPLDQLKSVKITSSESVLISNDKNFSNEFQKIKKTKQYIKRIENERRGIKALKDGIYFPSPSILKTEKCEKKAILISGTSSGLGESFFKNLHGKDHDIFCLSRRFLPYQEEAGKNNNNAFLIHCDFTKLSKFSDNLKKIKKCLNIYKEIIYINNAGSILPVHQIGLMDNKEIISSVNVNYIAPILITNMLFTLRHVGIKVLNISSGAANNPIDGWSIYCSAKAGSRMFFDVLSLQILNNSKHSVNNIDLGILNTKIQSQIRNFDSDNFPRVDEFVDLNNKDLLLDPDEVACKIINKYIL